MKFRPVLCVLLACLLAATAPTPVSYAQSPADDDSTGQEGRRRNDRRRRGGGSGAGENLLLMSLHSEEVRKELKLTEDQEAAIGKVTKENRPQRSDRSSFREMTSEQRSDFLAKMQSERADRAAKLKEQLEEVLLPEQMERAQQISLQWLGARALSVPEVALEVGLTADQQSQLKELQQSVQDEMRGKMREMFAEQGDKLDRDDMREAITDMRSEMDAKVMEILTADQKASFDAMKGEPFTLANGPFSFGSARGEGSDRRVGRRGGRDGRGGQGEGKRRGGQRKNSKRADSDRSGDDRSGDDRSGVSGDNP